MILLVRSNGIYSDSRVEKYISFYREQEIPYTILGWDRSNNSPSSDSIIFFKRTASFASGGVKAMWNRIFWFVFVVKFLVKNGESYEVIHACDLDCSFPVSLYKALWNKKAFYIFDVFDWFSALSNNKLAVFFAKFMERFSTRYANEIIICESERRIQIPYKLKKEPLVLPNIPCFNNISFLESRDEYKFNNEKLTVSYVGWFGYARFLEELLDVAEEGVINLLIAGYGNPKIENRCTLLSKSNINVRYYGKVSYSTGLNIMYNSDIIYAMYCKQVSNHVYAAPNKYYEAMMLGVPILSTKGIIIGDKIEKLDIGYTIHETVDSLKECLTHIGIAEAKRKGKCAKEVWHRCYENFTIDFLKNEYLPLITKRK